MRVAVDQPLDELDADDRLRLMARRPPDQADVRARVERIVSDVRGRGDGALRDLASELDGVELESLEVPRSAWVAAADRLATEALDALERAASNIEAFHRAQMPRDIEMETEPGITLGRRWVPLPAVGVYAPGGSAAYPSSVLMGVVPARVAGVGEVVVCSPPSRVGGPSDGVLAACAVGGATRLFAIGGAGAVAAMAYGTESVPAVSAVVGPGNRWVTEAKRQVAGDVLIDSPAGPSEVLIVADEGAPAELVALEMVAQAEHDPDAAAVLITSSASVLDAVRSALATEVARAGRRDVVESALASRGGLVLAPSLDAAFEFAQEYAPEHLALYVEDLDDALDRVTSAGTVFLGPASSVAFGDYITGANHVLPTAGLARSFSGLSTNHFLRSFTYQRIDDQAAAALAGPTALLAEMEGLPGHARAAHSRNRP